MEVRELQYFVAVAEEQHVSRAAVRLGMAQPPLSRAIRQLERRLGVTLFDRSHRGVTLTPAGSVLLREGRAALDAVAAAERRTRRADGTDREPRLVLVTKAGASVELLAELVRTYAARPDAVEVEVVLCGPGEQEALLRDGRADVALLHRPFDSTAGLDTEELGTEGQVVVLPAGHPLSGRTRLRLADVMAASDLPSPWWPGPDGTRPEGAGPQVRNHEQLLQLVALGQTVAVLPESVRPQLHAGHAVVPLVDAPQVVTVIAWPPQSTSPALAALVRTAVDLVVPSTGDAHPPHSPLDHPVHGVGEPLRGG